MDFEERFLSEEDKNFLVRILKSVAKGNLVMVKRTAVAQSQSRTGAAGRNQQST
jgi:hypothetical protein